MDFKNELIALRQKMGLTQTQMAKELGVSFSTVNRLENGHFQPSHEVYEAFEELKQKQDVDYGVGAVKQNSKALSFKETNDIVSDIQSIIENAKKVAYQSVNFLLVERNWLIGKRISDEELKDTRKENYGLEIIKKISSSLTSKYGKGFSARNVYQFVQFYKAYPDILQTASAQSLLSWSHYLILLQVFDAEARRWYEQEAIKDAWSVRTLQRNVYTQYYYRILKSQRKDLVKKEMLEKTSSLEEKKLEFIKNPAILEFLEIPEDNSFVEKDLEKAILANLKNFLMEMGKGYAFVASQKRIHTEKEDYFIDLVFYNYILKCFVLVDLKMGKLSHQDVGQMDMYVQMYDEREKMPDDNPTIGILLCSETDQDVARYSMLGKSSQLFAAKYKTVLPSQEELKAEIEAQKTFFYLQQSKQKK